MILIHTILVKTKGRNLPFDAVYDGYSIVLQCRCGVGLRHTVRKANIDTGLIDIIESLNYEAITYTSLTLSISLKNFLA